jgi:integrase
MSPRRRAASRRNWPDHLHERDGYFSWRNPLTGKEHGLGRHRARAFAEAIEANLLIAGQRERPRLVDRLTGASEHALGAWLDRYEEIVAARAIAANTKKSTRSLIARARRDLDVRLPIAAVTPLLVTDACRALEAEGKARLAQAFRSMLKDCFREAIVAGWLNENPVRATRLAHVKVKRARLTLEVFQALLATDVAPWLRVAMELAVVTAQRREDVAGAAFADFRDGGWWLAQRKTGTRLVLPLELRLEALGLDLAGVLAGARRTGVVSRHLVHHTRPFGNAPVGARVHVDTISRTFSAAVAGLGLDWGDRTPPTFHEIRSLSERLYSLQGDVSTQALLGHRDPRMTAVYADVRGAEWVRVRVRAGGMREK